LNWTDNSDNEVGFKIFRNNILIFITDANTTSYTDNNLTQDTTYNYEIKATNDDFVKPTIVLKSDSFITLENGEEYVEYGVVATDDRDGNITQNVEINGSINISQAGIYTISYSVKDSSENMNLVKRTILVKTTTPSEYELYMPSLDLNSTIIYVSVDGNSTGETNESRTSFQNAINCASEGDTILVQAGTYEGIYFFNKHNLTIKAEEDNGVIISGEYETAINIQNSSYINIIGLEIKDMSYAVKGGNFSNHIFLSKLHIHNTLAAIYSGYDTHDWTIDKCRIHDISFGYGWYALGYHQALLNSLMYGINNHYMMVRGHTPLGESRDQLPLKDRDRSSYENILKDDWTHYIVHNTFGRELDDFTRGTRGAGVGIYAGGNSATDYDEYYLPPQNIVIANNVFSNLHEDRAIYINGEFGFDLNDSSHNEPILGTIIVNNITNEENIISLINNPDLSMINMSGNIDATVDTDILDQNLGFVDPNSTIPDYHLVDNNSSYLIDSASADYTVGTDITEKPRDTSPDIGAYEK
jgi:hypothetical protein